MSAERVLVRVQDRNVMLFQRMAQEDEFRIDYAHDSGWYESSRFLRTVNGYKFGFMKDSKIYEIGTSIETLRALHGAFPL